MPFNATSDINGGVATITLTGDLDASAAPAFREQVEQASAKQAKTLVLQVQGLDYIASAGLRVLVFAKQKMGAQADIYIIGAQEQAMDTLKKTGVANSVIIQDAYDPSNTGKA